MPWALAIKSAVEEKPGLAHRIIGGTVRLFAYISGVALLWLMALTVLAVIMRYVFNAPILGAQDLSQVSLVLVVFPAMAYCGWTGGHVALDLIAAVLKPRVLRWSDSLVQLVCGVLFSYVTWQTWTRGLDAYKYGEASNLIAIPRSPFFFTIAISSGLYTLVLFIQAIKMARGKPRSSKQ